MKKLTFRITENDSVYLFLKKKGFSENLIKKLKKEFGQITVNGDSCNVRKAIRSGDELQLTFFDEKIDVPPADISLSIVYEDDDMLVIDKQYGLAVIPTASHYDRSLFSALRNIYGEYFPCHIVTRLDRDTSGLMLICKNSYSHSVINENLSSEVKRKYVAIVHGDILKNGYIEENISKSQYGMKRFVSPDGQYARTEYKILKNFDNKTMVEAELKTGRTHQIRVHFSYIGHSLCGDKLYGEDDGYFRQALHCCYLSFIHPTTLNRMNFSSFGDDIIDKLLMI